MPENNEMPNLEGKVERPETGGVLGFLSENAGVIKTISTAVFFVASIGAAIAQDGASAILMATAALASKESFQAASGFAR